MSESREAERATDPGAPAGDAAPAGVAVFDLDGTLTWRDTLLPFLRGYLARHPRRWMRLWRLVPAGVDYLLRGRDRGLLKSRLIRAVLGGESRADIDAWAEQFVHSMRHRGMFRPAALAALAAHRDAGQHLVLLSASPDLYVPRIGALLGVELTLCTEVGWRDGRLDGRLTTPNRHGAEKARCLAALRDRFPGQPFSAYGNSAADIAHLRAAEHGVLVNGNAAARRRAVAAGLDVAEWR